jgi:hypothetical protein
MKRRPLVTTAFALGGNPATTSTAPPGASSWKVENGYMEVTPGAGSLTSKERFKEFHLEFAEPAIPLGSSQYRGNSGVTIGGREIQILDNYNNATYADGYVGAIYNQWPPLSNPSRPPGGWQTMDVAYMAARFLEMPSAIATSGFDASRLSCRRRYRRRAASIDAVRS